MPSAKPVPFPRSYWVDALLLAGAYPGDGNDARGEAKVRGLYDAGVRTIVDLTHPLDQLRPYDRWLVGDAQRVAMPVRDVATPEGDHMDHIQAAIDSGQERGAVYVHCWGGRGRAGTAVGVYLIRRGLATPDDFVDVITELRKHDPGGGPSPETARQIAFVRSYVAKRAPRARS